ncbi:hypothetical protein COOONC_08933 [Cooperia oncophora]
MRAVRLPIKKYVKWQKGPMYLPFPNILRIFREVHLSGGDWENALLNNISKRHLLSPEDQEAQAQIERHKSAKDSTTREGRAYKNHQRSHRPFVICSKFKR